MDNFFFTNMAILVVLLTTLVPVGALFYLHARFSKEEKTKEESNS